MFRVRCHMRDADEGVYVKDYARIEESQVRLVLWEENGNWSVVPLSAMYFYDVEIVE